MNLILPVFSMLALLTPFATNLLLNRLAARDATPPPASQPARTSAPEHLAGYTPRQRAELAEIRRVTGFDRPRRRV